MKKKITSVLALGMILAICGGASTAEAKTYKVLSGSGEGVAAYDVFQAVVTKYQNEVDSDFNVEYPSLGFSTIIL